MKTSRTGLSVALFGMAFAGQTGYCAKSAERPIWAKHATALDLNCLRQSKRSVSPDRLSSVRVICHEGKGDDPTYSIEVRTHEGRVYKASLDEGAHELLWSPDSRAFFVNGGTSAYAGFFVSVYQLKANGVRKVNVTGAAQRDMVIRYPPCRAYNRDEETCGQIASDLAFNMSGLAWHQASSAIDVFAEVPCSSSYGGIMCQVAGYVLSVPEGHILRRIPAAQISRNWRQNMTWNVRVPGPPKYGAANVTFSSLH